MPCATRARVASSSLLRRLSPLLQPLMCPLRVWLPAVLALALLARWAYAAQPSTVVSPRVGLYFVSSVPEGAGVGVDAGGAAPRASSADGVPLELRVSEVPTGDASAAATELAAVAAGRAPLSLVVLVLSCGRASCSAERARLRASVYNLTAWEAAAPEGFLYCGGGGGGGGGPGPAGSAGDTREGRVSWKALHRTARVRHFFLVGAAGVREAELPALSAEQAAHGDVVLLPSGDGYGELAEKVLHGLIWLGAISGLRFTAVLKTDADSLVRLPQLLWAAVAQLGRAVDPATGAHTDVYWGRFMVGFRRFSYEHDFAGGLGYIMTLGLVRSIVAQLTAAPFEGSARSTGGVPAMLGSAEDLVVSLLVATRPHARVSDPTRFHDVPELRGVNARRPDLATLVLHGLKTPEAWDRYAPLLLAPMASGAACPRQGEVRGWGWGEGGGEVASSTRRRA